MIGVYLASYKAYHPNYNIDYNDVFPFKHINLLCDMLDVDINFYDFVIASPPCNYYSRANYRRDSSLYALSTKHLLPDILNKLCSSNVKYWIVENVRNSKLFKSLGLFDLPCYVYFVGRHTYWSNIPINFSHIKQFPLTVVVNGKKLYMSSQNISRSHRQGTKEVFEVVEYFLNFIHNY